MGSGVTIEWAREPKERTARVQAELARVTSELARRGATLVVLFGSRARGDAHRDSDADLLVVMPLSEDQPRMRCLAELYEAVAPRAVDLLVFAPADFEAMRRDSSLVRRALEEGVVLHGA